MSTIVYGCSDDLIEFEGELVDEFGCWNSSPEFPVEIEFSDGTVLHAWYGKGDRGIWAIYVVREGTLIERIEPCESEDAPRYSDVAHFKDGVMGATCRYRDREPVEIA